MPEDIDEPALTNAANLDLQFFALTKDLMLQTYNANNFSTPIRSVKVTGLISAETILGIDIRPTTGQLYALGNTSTLYIINASTGQATMVGNGPFKPALTSIITGIDFNPGFDHLRIVTSTGQNIRVDPETATVISVDSNISVRGGGPVPQISGIATNGNVAGLGGFLWLVDVNTKTLYFNDALSLGELRVVGPLNIPNSSGDAGLDIAPDFTMLLTVSNGGPSSLYQVDRNTAACTYLGTFSTQMIGIAIPTYPVAYAVDASNTLFIFSPT